MTVEQLPELEAPTPLIDPNNQASLTDFFDQGFAGEWGSPISAKEKRTDSAFSKSPRRWWFTAEQLALTALVILATSVSVWNLNGAPAYQEDEGTYTSQAFSVLEGRLAPYTYWYDHPPLGWIQLGALAWIPHALGVGDGTIIGSTRYVIPVFFIFTTIMIFKISRRVGLQLPLAVVTVVIFILSPLSLVLGRQIYLDNIGVPWLLLAFYLALSRKRALWHHIGAGIFFAVSVLSKETLAIFGPALLLVLLNRPAWSNRIFSVVGFLSFGGMMLLIYPLLALLRSELLDGEGHVSLQSALSYQFLERSGSGSIFEAGSSRAELLEGWFYFDQYLIVAGVVGAVLCLFRRNLQWIFVAVASFATPVIAGQGYLPAMYVLGVLPFLSLAVGGGLSVLWGLTLEKWVKRRGTAGRTVGRTVASLVICSGLLFMSIPQWFEQDRVLLTSQQNTDWRQALQWTKDNVSRDDVVLAPYSMWQDLKSSGWPGPWAVIVTEKIDLDSQFLVEHPEGTAAVDWIIVGPIVVDNVKNLDLTQVGELIENSHPVATFGEWSVRRVNDTYK